MKLYKSLFMFLLTLPCLCSYPSLAKGQARGAPKAIYVGEISADGGFGFLPLLDLSESLANHPHARLFQVDWNNEAGSYSELGTVLYDRLGGILEYICKGDHNAGYGLTGEYRRRAAVREHFLFTQVSAATITKAAAAAKKQYGDIPTDAFNSLQRYGCPRRTLRGQPNPIVEVSNGIGRVRQR